MTNGLYQLWDPTTGESRSNTGLSFDPASAPSFLEAARAQGGKLDELRKLYSAVAFSRDGRLVAFPTGPDTIEVREKENGKLIRRLKPESKLWTLAFTSDGSRLVVGGVNGTITLWHLGTGRKEWEKVKGRERVSNGWGYVSVAISLDGRRLATAAGAAPFVLREVTSGEIIATLDDDPRLRYEACAFNAEGTQLAVGCDGLDRQFGLVKVFDVASGRKLYELHGHTSRMFAVAFSPDGRRIASASGNRTVKLWDTVRRKEVLTLRGHTQGVFRVAFSPDGNLLASSSFDWTVRIWDARPLP